MSYLLSLLFCFCVCLLIGCGSGRALRYFSRSQHVLAIVVVTSVLELLCVAAVVAVAALLFA